MDVDGKRKTSCTTAGPIMVTERDGKILRVEPMQFNPTEVDSWEVVKNGKTYRPPLIHPVLPWGLIVKQSLYSKNRILHPLKRVDWQPGGDPSKTNTQNRGSSGYEQISWDEALDIIEYEIRRVIENYGNSTIAVAESAHPEWGSLQYFMSGWRRFWDMMGSTELESSPISWEGWAAGPTFIWGFWHSFGFPPSPDTLRDTTEYSDLIVLWGTDPLMHGLYSGIDQARVWQYWKDLGKTIIVIDPLCNEMAATVADKWIPILPGTDAAMALAILYTWISEGSLDQGFLDSKCLGFDEEHMPEGVPAGLSMKSYVLGEADDAVAKTPEWAESICGISAATIRTLAREWGAKPTSLWVLGGGACRRQYAHEFTRLAAILTLAQGIGKPGVNILSPTISLAGPYDNFGQLGPLGYADGGMNSVLSSYPVNNSGQIIQLQKFADCIENPPQQWNGGRIFNLNAQEWWTHHEYPAPGCSEVHFYWQRGSSAFNEPDRNRHIRTLKNPKIETFIVSAPWFDRDCRYADLVLPVKLGLECEDITEPANVGQFVPSAYIGLRSAVFHQKVVDVNGEGRNDIEVLGELARRLGCLDTYLEGASEEDLLKRMYERTNIPLDYQAFKEKGYYVWPAPKNYHENKQLADFYNLPLGASVPGPFGQNALATPSGKAEIFSTQIYEHYGYNPEIPPVPHYIPEREGIESLELKEKYPLQMTMAHPKYRFHGKYNDCSWLSDHYKLRGADGYDYEPIWMNRADAAKRNLEEGDIVRVFNNRGQLLAGLHITDRLAEGVIWLSYGSWNDPLDNSENPLDRAGDGNIISNAGPMSAHHPAGGTNSNLLEVAKADLQEIAEHYPEGMSGKYSTWNRRGSK